MVKNDALRTIGHDEKALVTADQHFSDASSSQFTSTQQSGFFGGRGGTKGKRNSIEYLNKSNQQAGETVRDFINNSRKILMAKI